MNYYEIKRIHVDKTNGTTYYTKLYTIRTHLLLFQVYKYFPKPDWIVSKVPCPTITLEGAVLDAQVKGLMKEFK